MTVEEAAWFAETFDKVVANVEQAVMGKTHVVGLALTCLLSGGHLLLEDVPGTGKTSLAKSLANTIQGSQNRIQFTPDLLPSDVTGVNIFNQKTGQFEFHRGPIFSTIVLGDEINRASPKTQSALLEVMEESRVTVDGIAYPVGDPFLVVATQNPIEQAGTYSLPEAQLDRFLMKTSLGYPDHDTTISLLSEASLRDRASSVKALITAKAVVEMAELASSVHVDASMLGYVSRIADATRAAPEAALGVSTRGCINYVRAAKTWAASKGRTYVVPDDIKELALPILGHRVLLTADSQFEGVTTERVIGRILADVAPPSERGVA